MSSPKEVSSETVYQKRAVIPIGADLEKQRIIEMFEEKGLKGITLDNFHYKDSGFLKKLVNFFENGYIKRPDTFQRQRNMIQQYNEKQNYSNEQQKNDTVKSSINYLIGINEVFLEELEEKQHVTNEEKKFLKEVMFYDKFAGFVPNPGFHKADDTSLRILVEEEPWKTYNEIIDLVMTRLYLHLKVIDNEKDNNNNNNNKDENSMDVTHDEIFNDEIMNLNNRTAKLKQHMESLKKKFGGTNKKTIKNKLKKRKTKKMKINKKNKRRH
uniref:Uncharacterized protein n=1 Tax=viral metagenome TaxID=1070528 RepID=A0A6C0ETT2_9ZZZZ